MVSVCKTKSQIKSEWIFEVIDFPNYQLKIWRISALKVYLKLNQKVVLTDVSTHGKPSLNMQKKSGEIVLYLEILNFKTFMAEILQIFQLLIWKIDDFMNSFWHNLTFS